MSSSGINATPMIINARNTTIMEKDEKAGL